MTRTQSQADGDSTGKMYIVIKPGNNVDKDKVFTDEVKAMQYVKNTLVWDDDSIRKWMDKDDYYKCFTDKNREYVVSQVDVN